MGDRPSPILSGVPLMHVGRSHRPRLLAAWPLTLVSRTMASLSVHRMRVGVEEEELEAGQETTCVTRLVANGAM